MYDRKLTPSISIHHEGLASSKMSLFSTSRTGSSSCSFSYMVELIQLMSRMAFFISFFSPFFNASRESRTLKASPKVNPVRLRDELAFRC